MSGNFMETSNLPFCKGCGHTIVMRNLEAALSSMPGLAPRDVITVSDIGCIGIIDRELATHTVHGLHGRSAALASGIAMGLKDRRAKIIVLLGDGGATIGLQHLLDAAQRNLDMTVIVHNNMLYGMTGGQPSSLTPCGYKTAIKPQGKEDRGVDICALAAATGAPFVARLAAVGDFSATLREALAFEGFSLVEMLELCTSHGAKLNPGRNLRDIAEAAGLRLGKLTSVSAEKKAKPAAASPLPSLFDLFPPMGGAESPAPVPGDTRVALTLAGSAGEGVQTAAEFLAKAAMSRGFHVSKKSSYPVTVGVGFSVAEVIVSSAPIRYTGAVSPNAIIVTSSDGLAKVKTQIAAMTGGRVYADESLQLPSSHAETRIFPYRAKAGDRNACLLAVMDFLKTEKVFPVDALVDTIQNSKSRLENPAGLAKTLDD